MTVRDDHLAFALEQRFREQGRVILDARRPAGRISALAFDERHVSSPLLWNGRGKRPKGRSFGCSDAVMLARPALPRWLRPSPASTPNSDKGKPGAVSRPGALPEFLFPDIGHGDSCQALKVKGAGGALGRRLNGGSAEVFSSVQAILVLMPTGGHEIDFERLRRRKRLQYEGTTGAFPSDWSRRPIWALVALRPRGPTTRAQAHW
jgi:hypothetical protein